MTSIFSASNTYALCGPRTLYGLALEGQAPEFLLKSLDVRITTQFHDPAPELNLGFTEVQQVFANDLRSHQISSNLRHLNICTVEMMWGYRPPFDPRGLYFPDLISLALGRVTFAYDWQLDWVIGNAKTLEILALTDCMMLTGGAESDEVEAPSATDNKQWWWLFDTRWYEYFNRFQCELPLLKRFITCASSSPSRLEGLDGPNALSCSSCMMSTGSYGFLGYCEAYKAEDGVPVYEEADGLYDEAPSAPDCYKEDRRALDELLEAIT